MSRPGSPRRREDSAEYMRKFQILVDEGFTANEAWYIAHTNIEAPPIIRLRDSRIELINSYVDSGYSRGASIAEARSYVRVRGETVDTWERLNAVYPRRGMPPPPPREEPVEPETEVPLVVERPPQEPGLWRRIMRRVPLVGRWFQFMRQR